MGWLSTEPYPSGMWCFAPVSLLGGGSRRWHGASGSLRQCLTRLSFPPPPVSPWVLLKQCARPLGLWGTALCQDWFPARGKKIPTDKKKKHPNKKPHRFLGKHPNRWIWIFVSLSKLCATVFSLLLKKQVGLGPFPCFTHFSPFVHINSEGCFVEMPFKFLRALRE